MKVPFNKPFFSGKELEYITQAVESGMISGNGAFTKKCQAFFEERFGFRKCLLTTSCTDALEMVAILMELHPGDEVIMPSYTFVSTANAFALRGVTVRFVDSRPDHPGIDETKVEELINPSTKAIVVVHYAGVACDMDSIMALAEKYDLLVAEDAAQAIDAYYNNKPLGGFGHFATFSFHETKNIISGEGGMLVINDERFIARAEIIWEKGTNRAAFHRGEVDKYNWVDLGSSFLPSELTAAFLLAQLEGMDHIQEVRRKHWKCYQNALSSLDLSGAQLPSIPPFASNNAHMFYLVCRTLEQRSALIAHLKANDCLAVFHYLSLHASPYFHQRHDGRSLPQSDRYSDCLVRLPLYYSFTENEQAKVIEAVQGFFNQ